LINIQRVLLYSCNDLFGGLSKGKFMFDLSVDAFKSMDRVLHIHLVSVIVLEHVVFEVIGQLQTEHIFFEWNQIHVYLRNFIFLKEKMLVEQFITLDGSSWNKEDVDFDVGLFPIVLLFDDLLNNIDIRSYSEQHRLVVRLKNGV